jgi:hypothetical protein
METRDSICEEFRRVEGDNLVLDGIPLGDLTAPGLLGVTVLMMLLGWIVPRKTLNDQIKQTEKWQTAYELERQSRVSSDSQTTELLEIVKATYSIVVAQDGSGRSRQSGEANVVSAPTSK